VFVIGTRTVATNSGRTNSSRALQAATTHYFKITCSAGAAASGSFTTRTVPSGMGYGEPIPIDPANNGSYFYPTFSTTDRTASIVEPHTGTLVRNLTLPGDLTGGAIAAMTSSGSGDMCSPIPVAASNGKLGYHCQLFENGLPVLYWIAKDGEARFLGVMTASYVDPGWNASTQCKGGLMAPFDIKDPNIFYCSTIGNDAPKGAPPSARILLKATYTGHQTAQDADLSIQPNYTAAGMPHTTYTQMLPWTRDLATLAAEFSPDYRKYGLACCDIASHYWQGDWANGKFFFMSAMTQDTAGWITAYDPNQTAAMQLAQFGSTAGCIDNPPVTGTTYSGKTGCIVASTGTLTGGLGSSFRWSVLHQMDATSASPLLSITMNTLRLKTNLAYQVTLASALSGSSAAGTCTMAEPQGSLIKDWPDATWPYGCTTITVTGDPALSGASTTMPASLPALAGDLLSTDSAGHTHHETLRLLDKGSDGRTWYIQRRYLYGTTFPYSSVAVGGTLDMMSAAIYPDPNNSGMQVWWDTVAGALTTDATNTYVETLPINHTAYINHPMYGRWSLATGAVVSGMEPARFINVPPMLAQGVPGFNRLGASLAQIAVEGHPSLSVSDPPDRDTYNQVVDNHPYYGSGLVAASNVTLVAGQLYRIRGLSVAANYKAIPYFANSGSRAMRQVSGPAVQLTTDASTQFQWCVALKSNECYAGSAAGDIYFNAPNVANAYCTYNWLTLQTTTNVPNDICVGMLTSAVQAVTIQSIGNDPAGQQYRLLSNALDKYDQQSNFWNSRTIPDGSWLFTSLAADLSVKLIRIPPRAPDNVNRQGYVPVQITLRGGAAANNAVVQFGYAEDGPATAFYCTERQESCVASAAAMNSAVPFYFATTEAASIGGVPCANGCTVTIPSVPGRVVYYRAQFRDSLGNVVAQEPVGVLATP